MIKNKLIPQRIYQRCKSSSERGFTLLEVLVSILVLTGFLLGSLQATVLATYLRIQAQDKKNASTWVQKDLELIRNRAITLDNPTVETGLSPSNTDACKDHEYGDRLEDFIDGTHLASEDITIDNNPYDVTRIYSTNGDVLNISYEVKYDPLHPRYKSSTGDNIVTSLDAGVLPNAACVS